MFCKNCGKEFGNDTKYCPSCGTSVDDEKMNAYFSESNSELKKWVTIVCSLISAVGIFLPILIANTFWWEGVDMSFSLFDFFGLFNKESDVYEIFAGFWDDNNMGIFYLLPILAVLVAASTTLVGIGLLIDVNRKVNTEAVMSTGSIIAKMGVVYSVATIIFMYIENRQARVYLDGDVMQFFELTFWGWLLLIVAIVNLCVSNSGVKQHAANAGGGKVCPKCGKKYRIGTRCPACGVELVEKN